jgi:hypothetical protein
MTPMEVLGYLLFFTLGVTIGIWAGVYLERYNDQCDCAHCKAHREEEKATHCETCGAKLPRGYNPPPENIKPPKRVPPAPPKKTYR